MTLKLATHEDIPEVVDLIDSFIAGSQYANMDHSREKIEEIVLGLLKDKNKGIVILYLVNDKPVGLIGGLATEMVFSRETVATELFWWVNPSYRSRKALSLKEAFEFWGKRIGAKFIQMSGMQDEKLARYYKRTGYDLVENAFVKKVTV